MLKRRRFLQGSAAAVLSGYLTDVVAQAAAIGAAPGTGTIRDIEHIVILTQENRSFDHYFGCLRGVRGFGDTRVASLGPGRTVFAQRDEGSAGNSREVLPFRPDLPDLGQRFLPDIDHDWESSHAAWNQGRYDQWIASKGIAAMSHMTRSDIPFHYALADAFTICDAYHCSLLGPTDPNRYYLWSGSVGQGGGGPVVNNAEVGYSWLTYPEVLSRAGVSWQVYQDVGAGLSAQEHWGWAKDPYTGNFGDNALLYFKQYQTAPAEDALQRFARTGTQVASAGSLFDLLRQDLASGRLPQVSWIVAPEAYSEHPNWPANYGAWYLAQVIQALSADEAIWRKTALFINYDEGGGFFDHVVPPYPPPAAAAGAATVDYRDEIFPGDATRAAAPYGLGTRVPMIVVSPWSRGGWVCSEVFDHTSLIRFIERRFGADYPGLLTPDLISPWRRAVCGDLTSAFDFRHAAARVPVLPAVAAYQPADHVRHADEKILAPPTAALPVQEPGIRPARPLPYRLAVRGSTLPRTRAIRLEFINDGAAGVCFQVRSGDAQRGPWTYTVEAGKALAATWDDAGAQSPGYDLQVHGPNGFFRQFAGEYAAPEDTAPEVELRQDERGDVWLLLRYPSPHALTPPMTLLVFDAYTGKTSPRALGPGAAHELSIDRRANFGWYDLSVSRQGEGRFLRRLAGHIETGQASMSDPNFGRVIRA